MIRTADLVASAARALRANPMRSALTALGVIIGVGSVVAMVALGAGAQAQVERSIASLGSNLLIVVPGAAQSGGLRMAVGGGGRDTLTLADIPAGTALYRYFELDIERPSVPNVEAWYRRLGDRPAYREHVMVPFDELRGRLAY